MKLRYLYLERPITLAGDTIQSMASDKFDLDWDDANQNVFSIYHKTKKAHCYTGMSNAKQWEPEPEPIETPPKAKK